MIDLICKIINSCKEIFIKKNSDYGMSWTILRLSSITDQISMKIIRIKSVYEKRHQLVEDPIEDDFIGIVNYSIMALLKIHKNQKLSMLTKEDLGALYDYIILEKILNRLSFLFYDCVHETSSIKEYNENEILRNLLSNLEALRTYEDNFIEQETYLKEKYFVDLIIYATMGLIKKQNFLK